MGKRKENVKHWNISVPKPLNEALNTAVDKDFHQSKAEFIRSAVREKLAKMGITGVNPDDRPT